MKDIHLNKGKLIKFLLFALFIAASLVYGIFLGDPQDMQIEASTL